MRNSLAVWVVLVACSGSGSVPLDQFENQLAGAYCSYYVRCGAFPDVATCEMTAAGGNSATDEIAAVEQAINDGKFSYNATAAQQCLDGIANLSCDRTQARGEPAACTQLFSGTAGSGSACETDVECKSAVCEIPSCGSACCVGECVGDAPPMAGGLGSSCTDSSQCQSGLYCGLAPTMESNECLMLDGAGSSCDGTDESCQVGLACDETTEQCTTLPATGEACPHQQCADVGDFCGSDGLCHKDGLPGDACSGNGECSPFYTCDPTTMKCVQGPGLGSSCAESSCFDGDTYCDTGSSNPTCLQKQADGAACTTGQECESDDCEGSACVPATICL